MLKQGFKIWSDESSVSWINRAKPSFLCSRDRKTSVFCFWSTLENSFYGGSDDVTKQGVAGLFLCLRGALICLWLSLCVGLWKQNYFYVISECSSRIFDYNLVEVNWGKINCSAMNSCCNIFCRNQNALITQCDYECTQMVSQRNKTFQCQSSLLIIGERHLFQPVFLVCSATMNF